MALALVGGGRQFTSAAARLATQLGGPHEAPARLLHNRASFERLQLDCAFLTPRPQIDLHFPAPLLNPLGGDAGNSAASRLCLRL